MSNTKLYIGSEQADFNEVFNVMFSIGDIRDIGFGNNNKTYTLNIPLTVTNKRLLKFINDPSVKTEVSAKGRLYLDEILIIQGTIYISNMTDYSASVIISSDDWIETLKNRRMTDLDLSTYDHALTHTNVEDSWTAVYPFYRYPMIDFGALQSLGSQWWPTDFVPAFQLSKIIEAILSPYTISSTFLASAYFKDKYILARGLMASDNFINDKGLEVKVEVDTDNQDSYSLAGGATVTRTLTKNPLDMNTVTTDEGSDYSTATDIYTVPETGTYRFQAQFSLYNDINPGDVQINSQTITLRIYQNAVIVAEYTQTAASAIIDGAVILIDTKYIHCAAGDTIKGYLYLSSNMTSLIGGPQTITMGAANTVTYMKNLWSDANRWPGLGKTIQAESLMPDVSQLEFIAAIRDLYNLRFWFDKQRQVMYIEPWDQFLSSTVKDITQYVDFDDMPAELVSPNYNKTVRLKWKDDTGDGITNQYLKTGASFGEKVITLSSIFTKPGEQIKEHQFSTIISMASSGLPSIRNTEYADETGLEYKRPANWNTRIVHWDGLTAYSSWDYDGTAKVQFPKVSGISFSTIYDSYLMKFFHYIDQGKLFKVKMRLRPGMLTEFLTVVSTAADEAFRPVYKITIKGSDCYFFLQKITSDGVMAELELVLKQ